MIVAYGSKLEISSTLLNQMKTWLEQTVIQTVSTQEMETKILATALLMEPWRLNVKRRMTVSTNYFKLFCIQTSIFIVNKTVHAIYSGLSTFLTTQRSFLLPEQEEIVNKKRALPAICYFCFPPDYCVNGECWNSGKLFPA